MKDIGIIMALFVMFSAGPVLGQAGLTAQDETDADEDWLQRHGITVETAYTGEFWTNLRGGFAQANTSMHDIDVSASFDTERLGLWSDGQFFVYVLSNQGASLLTEEIIGDSQTVSNIEAPHSTRLYEAWYEHLLLDGELSFLMEIHDLNSEFAVTEHGALFIRLPLHF